MAGQTGWKRHDLDLAKAGVMLRDYAVVSEGDPIEASVFMDGRGKHRRITARYADGWSLRVNFALDGKVSSFSLDCKLRGTVRA